MGGSSLGTMIWTFAFGSRSNIDQPLWHLVLAQDEHLLEKGQVAKTLEVTGCKVARAKDYSWKVRKAKLFLEFDAFLGLGVARRPV